MLELKTGEFRLRPEPKFRDCTSSNPIGQMAYLFKQSTLFGLVIDLSELFLERDLQSNRTLERKDPCRLFRPDLYALNTDVHSVGILMSQTFDIIQLTDIPTMQPNTTSATLCSPCSIPTVVESKEVPAVMMSAAVMGACRHIVLMRTK